MGEEKQWYSNKELFEMIEGFTKEVNELKTEMAKTTTLIRDYNGLRGKIDSVSNKVNKLESVFQTSFNNRRDYIGWIFAILMFILALLSFLNSYFRG